MDSMVKYGENLSKLFFDLKNEYQYKQNKFDSFDTLGRFCKNTSNFYTDKKKVFDEKIREYFKYLNSELKELKNLCNDSQYAKINLEKQENSLNNLEKTKGTNYKNEALYNYEFQKKKIEKNLAQRTCNFLRNRALEEFERIINTHYQRTEKYFYNLGKDILDIIQKEYSTSSQIIKCFDISKN